MYLLSPAPRDQAELALINPRPGRAMQVADSTIRRDNKDAGDELPNGVESGYTHMIPTAT